jgi:hypothetical protein
MTTVEAPADYSQYVGQKVDISYTQGSTNVTETGIIKTANSRGLQLVVKSKTTLLLNHEVQNIVATGPAPKAVAGLKARRVDPVTLETVRKHLANAHGALLSDLAGSDNAALYAQHESWHAEAGENSPHFHAEKEVKPS